MHPLSTLQTIVLLRRAQAKHYSMISSHNSSRLINRRCKWTFTRLGCDGTIRVCSHWLVATVRAKYVASVYFKCEKYGIHIRVTGDIKRYFRCRSVWRYPEVYWDIRPWKWKFILIHGEFWKKTRRSIFYLFQKCQQNFRFWILKVKIVGSKRT